MTINLVVIWCILFNHASKLGLSSSLVSLQLFVSTSHHLYTASLFKNLRAFMLSLGREIAIQSKAHGVLRS